MFRFVCKLKYIKVKTSEGGGVLHIIFRKARDLPPIPKNWLHKTWDKIWGSWNTSIDEVSIGDAYRTLLMLWADILLINLLLE